MAAARRGKNKWRRLRMSGKREKGNQEAAPEDGLDQLDDP